MSDTPIADLIEKMLGPGGGPPGMLEAVRMIEMSRVTQRDSSVTERDIGVTGSVTKRDRARILARLRQRKRRGKTVTSALLVDAEDTTTAPISKRDSSVTKSVTPRDFSLSFFTDSPRESEEVRKKNRKRLVEGRDDWPDGYPDKFWDAYPKGRKIARKNVAAKLAAIRKSGVVTWAALMAGLQRYIDSDPGAYVCAPMVWLNREGWNDEITIRGGANGKTADAAYRNGDGSRNGHGGGAGRLGGQTRDDAIIAGMGKVAHRLARNRDDQRPDDPVFDLGSAETGDRGTECA